MPNNFSNKDIYDSFEMFHPDGTFMCFCNKKRAFWYVQRGLANWIEGSDVKFKLKFEPQGKGKSDNPYYTKRIDNKCVVCGAVHELNKHHVVPYVFRSRFPIELKESNHHDILPICIDCHEAYEEIANEFKKELAKDVGAMFHVKLTQEERDLKKIISAKRLLSKIKNNEITGVPEDRVIELNILANSVVNVNFDEKNALNHWADAIVENLKTTEDIYSFMVMWRKHFIKEMNPKFLPEHWSVDFDLEHS